MILVFDAASSTRPAVASALRPVAEERKGWLGALRPAQRYVLEGGLDRAQGVNEYLAEQCGDDPWASCARPLAVRVIRWR